MGYKMQNDAANLFLFEKEKWLTAESRIYHDQLYYVIIALFSISWCILLYLLYINIASQLVMKNYQLSMMWVCMRSLLRYLGLLHLICFFSIPVLLMKHINIFPSRYMCECANRFELVSKQIIITLVSLVYKGRYEIMNCFLDQHSWMAKGTQVLTKMIVFVPLAMLPIDIYGQTIHWNKTYDDICWTSIPVSWGFLTMTLTLAVSLIFTCLFMVQMWLVHRAWKRYECSRIRVLSRSRELESAWIAALRNVALTFLTSVWLVLYYGPLNKSLPEKDNKTFASNIYWERITLCLFWLTSNLVLYFVFRQWSFFLCYPCRKDGLKLRLLGVEDHETSSAVTSITYDQA